MRALWCITDGIAGIFAVEARSASSSLFKRATSHGFDVIAALCFPKVGSSFAFERT